MNSKISAAEKAAIVGGLVVTIIGAFLLEGNDMAVVSHVGAFSVAREVLGHAMLLAGTVLAGLTGYKVVTRPY